MNSQPTRCDRAFTLVELLVVIAIIVMLMALLLPALSRAQDRAKASACLNNERQIGIGFSAYLGDNAGFYPYAFPWPTSSRCAAYYGTYSWFSVLASYLGYSTNGAPSGSLLQPEAFACQKNIKIMQCPSNPWPFLGTVLGSSYAMNRSFLPSNFYGSYGSWVTPFFCTNGGSAMSATPPEPGSGNMGFSKRVNMSDIEHPSGVMLLGEVPIAPPNYRITPSFTTPGVGMPSSFGYAWLGVGYCQVTNMSVGGANPTACKPPYNSGNGDLEWIQPSFNQMVSTFHSLCMNVLYPDGHVSAVSKSTLINHCLDVGIVRSGETNASSGWVFWEDLKQSSQGNSWYWRRFPDAPIN